MRSSSLRREQLVMVAGMVLIALAFAALPFAGSLAVVFVCTCAVGLAIGPVDVALLSLRQRRTDSAQLSRVLAISMSLNLAGFPVGAAISGPLVGVSPAIALAFATAICASAAAIALYTVG